MTSQQQEQPRRRRALFAFLLLGLIAFSGLATASLMSTEPEIPPGVAAPRATSPAPSATPRVVLGSSAPVTADVETQQGSTSGQGSTASGSLLAVQGVPAGSLSPGQPTALVVTLANHGDRDLTLVVVSGTITAVTSGGEAGIPSCRREWFHIGSFSGSRALPRQGTAQVRLPLTLDNLPGLNQDNCKSVRYTFELSAQARES